MEPLTAFRDGSLGWFLGWELWNWPDISKSWAVEELLNKNNCPISLLAWSRLCPAAWGGAAGPEHCQLIYVQHRMHHLWWSSQVPLSVPLSSHLHLPCFKSLCGVFSLWKFSSDSGALCGDLMASTTSLVHITVCHLGSHVPLLGSFWLCCSPFPCKGAVIWGFFLSTETAVGALCKALVL